MAPDRSPSSSRVEKEEPLAEGFPGSLAKEGSEIMERPVDTPRKGKGWFHSSRARSRPQEGGEDPFLPQGSSRRGRPVPADEGDVPSTRVDEILLGLEQNMPLIFFAAVCLSISYIFWGQLARIGEHSYPLWLLFLILGVVAAAGGTIAAFLPREEAAEPPTDMDGPVVIPRARWHEVTHELEDLRGLVKNVQPEDLVKAALDRPAELSPEAPEMAGASAVRRVSQGTRALDLALTAGIHRVEPENPMPVQEPAPLAVPASVVPPPTGAGIPERSAVEREVDVFRTACVTGLQRNPGEGPEAFIDRASLVYASVGSKPEPLCVARSICAAVLETYRQLTSRQMEEFSKIVDSDLEKLVQVTKVVRNAREPLPEYVTRVKSILEAMARTEVEELPPAKESAGLEFSLALFRGFLENYLPRPYVDQVIAEVEQDATTGEGRCQLASSQGDELSTYSRFVKNSLKPLVGKVIDEEEIAALIREMDVFVEDLRTPAPAEGMASDPAEREKVTDPGVEGVSGTVPGIPRKGSEPSSSTRPDRIDEVRPPAKAPEEEQYRRRERLSNDHKGD